MNGDFVALSGGWSMWRGIVVRGAGFPVSDVDRLADPDLAAAADRALARAAEAGRKWPDESDLNEYHRLYPASVANTTAAISDIARQPLYREALTWQNPGFVRTCVDHIDSAGKRSPARLRKRQATFSTYIQRYTTKNDSIGFFGPVGWAEWTPGDRLSSLAPGRSLTRRRTVYFETWAIDEVAAALAARPDLAPGVPPRLSPACLLEGKKIIKPNGGTEVVSEEWARILGLCDGQRTPRDIAMAIGGEETWLIDQLALMVKSGLVRMDLSGPIEVHAERRLAQRLSRVPDASARESALADLGRLVSARDEVAASAGDPQRLEAALEEVAGRFESITGRPAVRLQGEAYAGRTIVYEDCIRDVRVSLGADVLESLGGPLGLVLDSARWLTARVGEVYLDKLAEHHERLSRRARADWVPLGRMLAVMSPDFYVGAGTPPLVAEAVRDMQQRWAGILSVPDDVRHHHVEPEQIAARVRSEFRSRAPQWAGGLRHSPDVLIDAPSVDAINRGDYRLVLGEVHTAFNTVEPVALAEQSEHKPRLRAMAEYATGPDRIVLTPSRGWDYVTRTRALADVLSPRHVHWTAGDDDVSEVMTEVLPLAALEAGPGLVVRCRTDQRTFPLAEVIGDYLSQVLVASFRMLPPREHSPRVSIGRLVVNRETWRVASHDCEWALSTNKADERRRFLHMRQWAAGLGMPRRVFCAVPGEGKPVYVDFASLPLMNSLATMLRRVGEDERVTFSEMLPAPDGCWLRDARGASYVSELRVVVTERR